MTDPFRAPICHPNPHPRGRLRMTDPGRATDQSRDAARTSPATPTEVQCGGQAMTVVTCGASLSSRRRWRSCAPRGSTCSASRSTSPTTTASRRPRPGSRSSAGSTSSSTTPASPAGCRRSRRRSPLSRSSASSTSTSSASSGSPTRCSRCSGAPPHPASSTCRAPWAPSACRPQEEPVGPLSGAYSPTKTYLNALTVQYAKELDVEGILVNAGCPGYVATDLNGHRGTRTPEQGAAVFLDLATLPDDGPTGTFSDETGVQPW